MSRAEFYRLTSAAIRRVMDNPMLQDEEERGVVTVARELAHTFAKHNSKFDAERFRRDCGVE